MSTLKETNEKYYGLLHKPTNKLLHVETFANDAEEQFCGDTRSELTMDEGDPLYLVCDLHHAVTTLYVDTPWYNSSTRTPGHSHVTIEDCSIVEVEIRQAITLINKELPIKVEYYGRGNVCDVPDERKHVYNTGTRYRLVIESKVVPSSSKELIDSVGKVIFIGSGFRYLYAADVEDFNKKGYCTAYVSEEVYEL